MSDYRKLYDGWLEEEIRELPLRLRDLEGCRVEVAVRGGVAHLSGHVPSPLHRRRLRAAIGSLRGIHAVWDRVVAPGEEAPRAVDLGCANQKQYPDNIGIDRHPLPAVDLVADLESAIPLGDKTVDQVYAVHVLEHVRNLLPLMAEIHRVLKPEGVLHVMVPHWRCVNAVADPTHVRYFDRQTFKYFCTPHPPLPAFRPLLVSATEFDLFADLQPVQPGEPRASESELCRFFD